MEKFTSEMINEYAENLLIGLTEEENKMVLEEFESIDKDIDKINNIPGIENVEPMSWCLDDFVCEMREDVAEESISIDEALSNCDDYLGREVRVPKVVDKNE